MHVCLEISTDLTAADVKYGQLKSSFLTLTKTRPRTRVMKSTTADNINRFSECLSGQFSNGLHFVKETDLATESKTVAKYQFVLWAV